MIVGNTVGKHKGKHRGSVGEPYEKHRERIGNTLRSTILLWVVVFFCNPPDLSLEYVGNIVRSIGFHCWVAMQRIAMDYGCSRMILCEYHKRAVTFHYTK